MFDKERGLYIAHCPNGALSITGKMANRHGLIAGATGTGKTVTLQVMAETFCQAGVPCFMADMKGDLSGISQVGKLSGFIEKRMPEFGIENPEFQSCPVRFFDVFGEQGHPMRATISQMGPQLLSRLMQLNETQDGVLNIVFRIADERGLLLIDLERLRAVNALGDMMIATRASGFMVKKGDKLCGTRVIPLVIKKERMELAKKLAGDAPIMRLVPVRPRKYGVVTTGNEVFYGRIEDTFTPVIQAKLAAFGCEMAEHVVLNDDHEKITAAVLDMLDKGCEMVFCSGGMSVDPDDKTPLAIKNTGANIVSYGAPVLPGAMFLVSYMPDGRPVCGLPGCVMYAKRTIFDLILPYLVTDTPVTKEWLAGLGHGGLCLNCPVCHFPNCGFGKGV